MSVYGESGGDGGVPPQGQVYALPPNQQPSYPPSVRFEAISEAWRIITGSFGTWILMTIVYIGISAVAGGVIGGMLGAVGLSPAFGTQSGTYSPSFIIGNLIQNIVSTALGAYFTAGLVRMTLNSLRHGTANLSDLFSGGDVFGSMLIAFVLFYIGSFVLMIPVIGVFAIGVSKTSNPIPLIAAILIAVLAMTFVSMRLYFIHFLIADRRLSAVEAIKTSWKATAGHTLSLFAFGLILGLVTLVGILITCFTGTLIAIPMIWVAMAIVYRDFFPDGLVPQGPTLDMPLPPPSAYQPGQYPPPPPPPQQ